MKRTDKYRDSYQYDNQNQNHRRQSEDASYRQQYAKGDPEEHPERYYNGRDYRREQILEEENEKSRRSKKWLYIIIAILLIIVAIFVTRALLNNDSDKVSNDPKVSQNYKKQVENQIDNLKQQEQNKADSKLTQFYQDQINKLTEANNALKNNASQGKIESMLNDINTKFDSIKSKLESLFKDDNGGAN
ncbi:hypothetical protein [Staphylococcus aureus]|uniref:hypothetical protein n=1 Tax=Staphylococcus aureus TaxID=1280 RepID=UPI0009335A7C|nr:hypothetical protein [Staphylococcus aureus]OJZ50643.1 hypothetical protein BJR00_04375 [Staphylococcus aureus]